MKTERRTGPPPKFNGRPGKTVRFYLSADAIDVLEELAPAGGRSALVSRLLTEEAARLAAEAGG